MMSVTKYSVYLKTLGLSVLCSVAFGLGACSGSGSSKTGGGSGGGGTPPAGNTAPVARTNGGQTVATGSLVTLDGSTSTDDNGISSYQWSQVSGATVTLNNANTAVANFTANTTGTFVFRLTVTDAGGLTSTQNVTITVVAGTVTISGTIQYQRVPFSATGNGLDYNAQVFMPSRGVTVQALDAGGNSVATTTTSNTGTYTLTVSPNTNIRIRVRAELIKTGAPAWNVQVVDNTNAQALWAVTESTATTSGTANSTRNLNIASGWTGTTYNNTARLAAPFALADSIYSAITKTTAVDAAVNFPALKVNWSPNNVPSGNTPSNGQIGTSYYSNGEIYILGAQDTDTDEYDDHVVIHEWGHYFEDKLSRSDSIGGAHSGGDLLDPRVAFGEGFGNALSGIVTDDPKYRDSSGVQQSRDFTNNVETNDTNGWYDEATVQSILYDLYDNNADDTANLGWGPLYNTFVNTNYKNQNSFTGIFSFINQLKTNNAAQATLIGNLANGRGMNGNNVDDFGTNETNNGGNASNLPVYVVRAGAGTSSFCTHTDNGGQNKLGVHRYVRFTVPTTGSYQISLIPTGGNAASTDAAFEIFQQANYLGYFNASGAAATERTTRSFTAGLTYRFDMYDDNYANGNTGAARCFNLTIQ